MSGLDLKITPLTPKIPAKYQHMAPEIISDRVEFVLPNTSGAIANAIRRTITCELPVKGFYCNYEDIDTNDPFIIPEMIQKRIMMIPVRQSTHSGSWNIDVTNLTTSPMFVTAGMINPKPPCDSKITILVLGVGKYFKCKIGVNELYGYQTGNGMRALAVNAASVPIDVTPLNTFDNTGVPVSVSNPRVWKISFVTNGTITPKDLIIKAIESIIERIIGVTSGLAHVRKRESEYEFDIENESDTIGNIMMRTILDIYPDIPAVVYKVSVVDRVLTMRFRLTQPNLPEIIKTAIAKAIADLEVIKTMLL
jgi:DNA-directed RNA polymerase subunit L